MHFCPVLHGTLALFGHRQQASSRDSLFSENALGEGFKHRSHDVTREHHEHEGAKHKGDGEASERSSWVSF